MKNKMISMILAGVIVGVSAIGLIASIVKVPAGYVGVIYSMNGGVQNKVLSQGWHLKSPFNKVTNYSVATEQAFLSKDKKEGSPGDDSFQIPTSDGKTVNVDLEFSYHFDADKLPKTFSKFKGQSGDMIEKTFIRGKIKAWAAEASAKFSVMDIYGARRAELNKAVYEHVNQDFEKYGIVIDSVNFSRIGVDDQTAKAIQDRINAQQQLEKEKVEKDKAEIEAQKKVVQAKGEADARLVQAQAEADANKKIQESLSDTLVNYKRVEKWDGKMPQVSGGSPIIDMRK